MTRTTHFSNKERQRQDLISLIIRSLIRPRSRPISVELSSRSTDRLPVRMIARSGFFCAQFSACSVLSLQIRVLIYIQVRDINGFVVYVPRNVCHPFVVFYSGESSNYCDIIFGAAGRPIIVGNRTSRRATDYILAFCCSTTVLNCGLLASTHLSHLYVQLVYFGLFVRLRRAFV